MKSTLSIFFNEDRAYLAFVEPGLKGLSLKYIGTSSGYVNFQDCIAGGNSDLIDAVRQLLDNVEMDDSVRVCVTLPADAALISQFPGKKDMPVEDLTMLVNLEIRQLYPQFNYEDFTSNIYQLGRQVNGNDMMMAVIIAKQDYENCVKILSTIGHAIDNIEISQVNSHNAFMYNYPEHYSDNIALLGIQSHFLDLSIINSGDILYYNLFSYPDPDEILNICMREFNKFNNLGTGRLNAAYLFGAGLNKGLFQKISSNLVDLDIEIKRLNAFRLFSTTLGDREKEYCARISHILPPCIGAFLPSYHERIKLY